MYGTVVGGGGKGSTYEVAEGLSGQLAGGCAREEKCLLLVLDELGFAVVEHPLGARIAGFSGKYQFLLTSMAKIYFSGRVVPTLCGSWLYVVRLGWFLVGIRRRFGFSFGCRRLFLRAKVVPGNALHGGG